MKENECQTRQLLSVVSLPSLYACHGWGKLLLLGADAHMAYKFAQNHIMSTYSSVYARFNRMETNAFGIQILFTKNCFLICWFQFFFCRSIDVIFDQVYYSFMEKYV